MLNYNKFGRSYLPFSANTYIPPNWQPLDFFGRGVWTVGGTAYPKGAQPQLFNLLSPTSLTGPASVLQYTNYQGGIGPPFNQAVNAFIPYQSALMQTYPTGNQLTQTPDTGGLIDEGDEVVVDPRFSQPYDQIFGADEMFGLQ